MLLKLGSAYGGPTESRGTGIVAGCGRGNNLAKSYSHSALDYIRSWFKTDIGGDNAIEGDATDAKAPSAAATFIGNATHRDPVLPKSGLKSGTFVDDASMIMWATSKIERDNTELPHIAYEVSKKWTGIVRHDLRLSTSIKNSFIPPGIATEAAVAGCKFNDCTASVDAHGKDLGIDIVAAGKRNDSVLQLRAAASIEKRERHKFLVNIMASSGCGVKYVTKAQATGRQAMNLSQIYGNSVIGVSPTVHNQ